MSVAVGWGVYGASAGSAGMAQPHIKTLLLPGYGITSYREQIYNSQGAKLGLHRATQLAVGRGWGGQEGSYRLLLGKCENVTNPQCKEETAAYKGRLVQWMEGTGCHQSGKQLEVEPESRNNILYITQIKLFSDTMYKRLTRSILFGRWDDMEYIILYVQCCDSLVLYRIWDHGTLKVFTFTEKT